MALQISHLKIIVIIEECMVYTCSNFRHFNVTRGGGGNCVKPHQLTDLHIYMIHEGHERGTAAKHGPNLNFWDNYMVLFRNFREALKTDDLSDTPNTNTVLSL